jgi:hypothetical protein
MRHPTTSSSQPTLLVQSIASHSALKHFPDTGCIPARLHVRFRSKKMATLQPCRLHSGYVQILESRLIGTCSEEDRLLLHNLHVYKKGLICKQYAWPARGDLHRMTPAPRRHQICNGCEGCQTFNSTRRPCPIVRDREAGNAASFYHLGSVLRSWRFV